MKKGTCWRKSRSVGVLDEECSGEFFSWLSGVFRFRPRGGLCRLGKNPQKTKGTEAVLTFSEGFYSDRAFGGNIDNRRVGCTRAQSCDCYGCKPIIYEYWTD